MKVPRYDMNFPVPPHGRHNRVFPPSPPTLHVLASVIIGVAVVCGLYFGRAVLIPITLSVLMSFLLAPLVTMLRRLHLGAYLSIFLAVFATVCALAGVGALIAAQIVQLIGLPEGLYPLSQATIYLARAPKSDTIKKAYSAAAEDAAATAREPVPLHLRNAVTRLMKSVGYGEGYRYVHDDPRAKDEMTCLPESLAGRVYIEPEEPGGRSG